MDDLVVILGDSPTYPHVVLKLPSSPNPQPWPRVSVPGPFLDCHGARVHISALKCRRTRTRSLKVQPYTPE